MSSFLCSNRTFMELKYNAIFTYITRKLRSNRTFMELKYKKSMDLTSA